MIFSELFQTLPKLSQGFPELHQSLPKQPSPRTVARMTVVTLTPSNEYRHRSEGFPRTGYFVPA